MRVAVAVLILASLPLAARADIYRSVDAQGRLQYSDTPSPGAQLVRSTAVPTSSTSPAADKSASSTDTDAQIKDRLNKEAAARSTQRDVAQARAEQCKKTTDIYQASIQARRLFKTDANGDRVYLSDTDADQERTAYRLAMESACNNNSSP